MMQLDAAKPIAQPGAATAATAARAETLGAAMFAALLGVLLLWGVGFAPIAAIHNAAHDTRHAIAFPCH